MFFKGPFSGAYFWRGDLTEGFLRYEFWGLIFGGAYTWRGLYTYNSSFICIVVSPYTLNIITYILHTIFHTSPVVLTVVTGRIWITIRPSSKDAKATTKTTVAKTSLQKKCIPAVSNFIALVLPR